MLNNNKKNYEIFMSCQNCDTSTMFYAFHDIKAYQIQ